MAFQDIIHEQYRQKFYENRLQSMESANDLHRARRSTHGAAQWSWPKIKILGTLWIPLAIWHIYAILIDALHDVPVKHSDFESIAILKFMILIMDPNSLFIIGPISFLRGRMSHGFKAEVPIQNPCVPGRLAAFRSKLQGSQPWTPWIPLPASMSQIWTPVSSKGKGESCLNSGLSKASPGWKAAVLRDDLGCAYTIPGIVKKVSGACDLMC